MLRRQAILLSLMLLFALSASSYSPAQAPSQTTAEPITSLPRPPGDPDAPVTTPQQPTYAPPNSVHPITSLPKPPQPPAIYYPAAPTPATPPPVAPVPTIVQSPQPPITPPPAPPSQPYVIPSTSTPAAPPLPPQATPTLDTPLIANMRPAENPPPQVVVRHQKIHAFSTFGVAFKVGAEGIGVDVATPLAQHFNLRGGGSIFSYAGSYNDSGDVFTGTAQLRSGDLYLDYFPFHNGLHLSAGVFFNGSQLKGTTLVSPGTEFDLGNGTYYSSSTDPVHGTANFNLGKEIAPSFTIGFGNIIPRSGKHVSFPFEIGFAYNRAPTIALTLVGSVCDTSNPPNCQKIDDDPTAQADLLQEENNIDSDIRFLRFYPILSQGIAFSF